MPEWVPHGDRIERSTQENERRDNKDRNELELLKIICPYADNEAKERKTHAGHYKKAEHGQRVRYLQIDKQG